MLGPVKQQDEWDSPYLVRFLNIISDNEIAKVKELAKPRVSRLVFVSKVWWVFIVAVLMPHSWFGCIEMKILACAIMYTVQKLIAPN